MSKVSVTARETHCLFSKHVWVIFCPICLLHTREYYAAIRKNVPAPDDSGGSQDIGNGNSKVLYSINWSVSTTVIVS